MRQSNLCLIIFISLLFYGCSKEEKSSSELSSVHGSKTESYYTCTMHPQVHEHGPGNCPICGMPLVKVSSNPDSNKDKKHLLPSSYQKDVLNFTQTKVEMHKVEFRLSTSGRVMNQGQVAFYVYETDLSFIKIGQRFEGRSASGTNIKGFISSIDHIADPSSRAVRVIGKVNGAGFKLVEGSFFGTILSSPESTLMVPDDAVLRTGKKNIVYVINEKGEISPQEVELGRNQGDQIEILEGLEEGAVIASGPNFLLDSEARLRGIDD